MFVVMKHKLVHVSFCRKNFVHKSYDLKREAAVLVGIGTQNVNNLKHS